MAHYSTFDCVRRLSALAALAMTLMLPVLAHARAYGEKHITVSGKTVLSEDQFGSVVIDADDVELDCAGFQVHSSSYTKPNCELNTAKCGIVVTNHKRADIHNCNVVGDFDRGIEIWNSYGTILEDSAVTIEAGAGILLQYTQNLQAHRVNVTGGVYGVSAVSNDSLSFGPATITQASVTAIWSHLNTNSAFHHNTVSNSPTGYDGTNDNNEDVEFSTFTGNNNGVVFENSTSPGVAYNQIIDSGQNGIILISTDQALITSNVVTTSHSCDAKMLSSTSSRWYSNTFKKVCNDAPSHDIDDPPQSLLPF